MASFSAELHVAGHVFPVTHCHFEVEQATQLRGRVSAKVRYGPVRLVLDVPTGDVLPAWAVDAHKRQAANVVFLEAGGGRAVETLRLPAAYCVAYREQFVSGDAAGGAYQCYLTLSDPTGWTIQPGGPAGAFVAPAAREHGVPVAAVVSGLQSMAIGGGLGAVPNNTIEAPARQYIPASAKPRGMPLSPAEVEAEYGHMGVDLVNETQAEAMRLGTVTSSGATAESNRERGPVLTGVKDPLTGKTHFGKNVEKIPEDLHPMLKGRVEAYISQRDAGKINAESDDLLRAGVPGSHSEIIALDKAIKARESTTRQSMHESELSEFLLHNRSLMKKTLGQGVPPRCINCWHITEGVRVIGND
jgi:hypothetical protein